VKVHARVAVVMRARWAVSKTLGEVRKLEELTSSEVIFILTELIRNEIDMCIVTERNEKRHGS
jgi:hypothetical protein